MEELYFGKEEFPCSALGPCGLDGLGDLPFRVLGGFPLARSRNLIFGRKRGLEKAAFPEKRLEENETLQTHLARCVLVSFLNFFWFRAHTKLTFSFFPFLTGNRKII